MLHLSYLCAVISNNLNNNTQNLKHMIRTIHVLIQALYNSDTKTTTQMQKYKNENITGITVIIKDAFLLMKEL